MATALFRQFIFSPLSLDEQTVSPMTIFFVGSTGRSELSTTVILIINRTCDTVVQRNSDSETKQ